MTKVPHASYRRHKKSWENISLRGFYLYCCMLKQHRSADETSAQIYYVGADVDEPPTSPGEAPIEPEPQEIPPTQPDEDVPPTPPDEVPIEPEPEEIPPGQPDDVPPIDPGPDIEVPPPERRENLYL